MMPVSTNCTATDAFEGEGGRRRDRWASTRSAWVSVGTRRLYVAASDPRSGIADAASEIRRCAAVRRRVRAGCSASYARKPGLQPHQQRDQPDDHEAAEQGREPQRREGREGAGVERADARAAGDDDDEDALQASADGVGHRRLHHRDAVDRADVVGAAGDGEDDRRDHDEHERSACVASTTPGRRRRAPPRQQDEPEGGDRRRRRPGSPARCRGRGGARDRPGPRRGSRGRRPRRRRR